MSFLILSLKHYITQLGYQYYSLYFIFMNCSNHLWARHVIWFSLSHSGSPIGWLRKLVIVHHHALCKSCASSLSAVWSIFMCKRCVCLSDEPFINHSKNSFTNSISVGVIRTAQYIYRQTYPLLLCARPDLEACPTWQYTTAQIYLIISLLIIPGFPVFHRHSSTVS